MGKVKIRGIFATWTVADVAKSPEMVFRLNLETNPTHPFVPLSESSNKLILRMRSQQIFIGIFTVLAATLIAIALYYTQGNESLRGGGFSIFSVPAFIAAWGLALVIFNVQVNLLGHSLRQFLPRSYFVRNMAKVMFAQFLSLCPQGKGVKNALILFLPYTHIEGGGGGGGGVVVCICCRAHLGLPVRKISKPCDLYLRSYSYISEKWLNGHNS